MSIVHELKNAYEKNLTFPKGYLDLNICCIFPSIEFQISCYLTTQILS